MTLILSIAIGVFLGVYVVPSVVALILTALGWCIAIPIVFFGFIAMLIQPIVSFCLDALSALCNYCFNRANCNKCFQCREEEKSTIEFLNGHCSTSCLDTTNNHRFWISAGIVGLGVLLMVPSSWVLPLFVGFILLCNFLPDSAE